MSFLTEPTLEEAALLILGTAACAAAFTEARGKEPYQ